MMQSLRGSSLVMTILAAVGAAAYLWFSFVPQKHAIALLHAELDSKRTFAATAGRIAAEADRLDRESQVIDQYVVRWNGITATSVEIAALFGQIAEVIHEQGVETTRFAPDTTIPMARLRKIPLRVGCRGSHAKIASLIAALEKLPHRVWIEELSIEANDATSEDLQCELTLVVFANNPEKSG